jgi:RND superfamily putative drug exporter
VADPSARRQLNEAGDERASFTVDPTTSSQVAATDTMVEAVRNVAPTQLGLGLTLCSSRFGGTAFASTARTTRRQHDALSSAASTPCLVAAPAAVVRFRAPAVAIKAAIMNALSIGAAYGVVAYFMQGGWAGGLIGVDVETPLPAFIPVLMFAILFGLSMDYEVFLISRIREFWLQSGDASDAVTKGLAATARVITAAAAIMVAVFAAFVLSPDVFLKALGIGLATAVLVDATIIRMVLVPATMQILGRATWWLPGWLDRLLPQFHVEAPADAEELPDLPGQRRGEVDRTRTPTG